MSAFRFFVLRMSRLYPLHLATLLVVAGLQILYIETHTTPFIFAHDDGAHFLLQFAFASKWLAQQPFTFNGPAWSVSTDMLAYSVFFLAMTRIRPSLGLCALVVIVTELLMQQRREVTLSCVQLFFLGGFARQLIERLDSRGRRIAFCCASSVLVLAGVTLQQGTEITSEDVLIGSIGLVSWFAPAESVLGIDLSQWSWASNLTYASYLLHFPLPLAIVLATGALGLDRSVFLSPVVLGLFLLTTFIVARVVYTRFEMPMQTAMRAALVSRRPGLAVS